MNNLIFCDKVTKVDSDGNPVVDEKTGDNKTSLVFKPGRLVAGLLLVAAGGVAGYYFG